MTVTAPSESLELRAGDVFGGKYLLLEPIALGGMGRVWRARNLATGAEVAAKFLLPDHSSSPEALIRFRREARATAALFHRAIVRVFDLVEIDPERGSLVMILELLRGESLASRIERTGRCRSMTRWPWPSPSCRRSRTRTAWGSFTAT